MASTLNSPRNLSLYTIPAVWFIALIPALYVNSVASTKFDVTQPRSTIGKVADDQTLDSRTKSRMARAHGAQLNGFENIGLYAAAIVAGNMAGLNPTTLNYLSGGYVLSRIIYSFVYINAANPATVKYRTVAFLSGIGCVMTLFVKAGGVFQQGLRGASVGI
ncbi:hypothetical protein MMC07_001297 [Pseudocyphellaria aurata]|nr:hypothetical protein [Pseudocyphellaria aurata]